MQDDLGLSPSEQALVEGAAVAPWLVKPVYGFISDSFPIFGMKRKPYLFLCGCLGTAGYAYLAAVADSVPGVIAVRCTTLTNSPE